MFYLSLLTTSEQVTFP